MMLITKLLVVLLFILILFYMYIYFINKKNSYKEKVLEPFQDPGLDKDPLYLAKTNAANITYLKDKVDDLIKLKQQIDDINSRVNYNETGIKNISNQLITSSQQLTGVDPNSTDSLIKLFYF